MIIGCLFAFSLVFTALHAVEEVIGEGGPLWDNFGRIVGVRLPEHLGAFLFSVLLPAALVFLALGGYIGRDTFVLSLLLGARVGDTLISHWFLCLVGWSRPNPGILTTPLYVAEASLLLIHFRIEVLPALLGAGFFAVVLPSLWLAGRLMPLWRR